MNAQLLAVLLALAVFAIGLAALIGHALTARLLLIFGVVVAGAVALFDLVNYHS